MNLIQAFKKNRRYQIYLLAVVLLGIVILMLLPKPLPQKNPLPDASIPTSNQPNPSLPLGSPTDLSTLVLVSITPPPPAFESIWSTARITLTFNLPLDPSTINFQTSPQTRTQTIFDQEKPNSFSIVPLTGWEDGTQYAVTILRELRSQNGIGLSSDIVFYFVRTFPPADSPEFPNEEL